MFTLLIWSLAVRAVTVIGVHHLFPFPTFHLQLSQTSCGRSHKIKKIKTLYLNSSKGSKVQIKEMKYMNSAADMWGVWLASASPLHGLKCGPLSGWVWVAILCAALEGWVVVVHIDSFNLYDTKRAGWDTGNIHVFTRQRAWLSWIQYETLSSNQWQISHKPNICPLISNVTLSRSLALQN